MQPDIINAILDILILVAFLWFVDRLLVVTGARGLFQRLIDREFGGNGRRENDYPYLFDRLCKKADKKPLEMFLIARTEMGFTWSDKQVENHLAKYVGGGCQELPNYVEAFIDKGKEAILE